MVDFPDQTGKMCDWAVVAEVEGAKQVLAHLSKTAKIYVATGAADSSEQDIQAAFERVNLSQYISGYFCQSNLGIGKGSSEFFATILTKLKTPATAVEIVGDSLDHDIKPAVAAGMSAVWFTSKREHKPHKNIRCILSLRELII